MNHTHSLVDVRWWLLLVLLATGAERSCAVSVCYEKDEDWAPAFLSARAALVAAEFEGGVHEGQVQALCDRFEREFPVQWDWMLQDSEGAFGRWFDSDDFRQYLRKMIGRAAQTPPLSAAEAAELMGAIAAVRPGSEGDRALLDLYVRYCERRREARLAPLLSRWRRFVFAKHSNMGSSHYAYTESLSDSQYPADYHFLPGSALCVLEFDDLYGRVHTLLADDGGVIRNPDVSWDGERILFAWKKSLREDDYHLYEMDVADGTPRQLTFGLGYADYEGVYLPDGDILFNSTRCVQTVDCWWTEVSNLYTCDGDGRYMRRVSFDQVHTNYPTVMQDGRILYTRWDYNDRGQLFPQGLFHMNPDGTGQAAFYGNNSWFPTTLLHARDIPDSPLVVAIATGHHSFQAGQLILLDPGQGREENLGAQLIAPVRETKAVRVDAYGQQGALFQYPWPISDTEFLATYHPLGYQGQGVNRATTPRFGIYWLDIHGNRELLAADPDTSCNQPTPLARRTAPLPRPSAVDYTLETGAYAIQDIYAGPGLSGIERGTVQRLRVIALDYRAAGIGSNRNDGPAGSALVSTPIACNNGSWDVKRIIGDAVVHPDGSAYFTVPARTPLYFQALDDQGHAVQTMRSWSTLQPGETAACVGCHEHPNTAPPVLDGRLPLSLRGEAQQLASFYGPPRGFSFQQEIQPILDRHCIGCHNNRALARGAAAGAYIEAAASHAYPEDALSALSDHHTPAHSDDHTIPRFTWWPRRGGSEWVQYVFPEARTLIGVGLYWFDDAPSGGHCRVPESWVLHYLDGDAWVEIATSEYGTQRDCYNRAVFRTITTTALRLTVQLQDDFSGGLLSWRIYPTLKTVPEMKETSVFSLLGALNRDDDAKRMWSDAYLNLTRNGPHELVNWLSAQSEPPMLNPYHAGAARSRLIEMLRDGHHDVVLNREEMDKIAAWIDLLVPYCGDYTEAHAWSEAEIEKYDRFMKKRIHSEQEDRENIEALLQSRRER